jgi:hypothetical protein
MHQATGKEIEKAEELKGALEKCIDAAFAELGPDSKEFKAAVYATQDFVGWLYVVGKADAVRHSLGEVKKMASLKYEEYDVRAPEFLTT